MSRGGNGLASTTIAVCSPSVYMLPLYTALKKMQGQNRKVQVALTIRRATHLPFCLLNLFTTQPKKGGRASWSFWLARISCHHGIAIAALTLIYAASGCRRSPPMPSSRPRGGASSPYAAAAARADRALAARRRPAATAAGGRRWTAWPSGSAAASPRCSSRPWSGARASTCARTTTSSTTSGGTRRRR